MKEHVVGVPSDPYQVSHREPIMPDQQQHSGERTYFISIPISALTGHLTEGQLDKISMNLAIYGAGVMLIGLVAISFPVLFVLAMAKFMGWLLVLAGAMPLLQFLFMFGAPGMSSFLLLGVLHMLIGLWILAYPIRAGGTFILLLASWFFIHGMIKLVMAAQLRNLVTWPALMASGLVSVVLAFMSLVLVPRFGLVMLSIVFGADMVASGASLLLLSCIAFFGKGAVSEARPLREPLMTGMSQAAASA